MWKMFLIVVTCVGCVASGGERAAVQEVTGVTVTVRDAGQLAVSWTVDPLASRYLVYQSVGGALPALVATVFDSGGGAPSTSWIATNLTGGVEYCFAIRSGFADGGVGAPGGSGCATAGEAPMPATSPLPTATTYVTVPSSLFSQSDIHVGINGQVYQLPVSTGQLTSASMAAQCASGGFVIACARIRERGTWDWCSKPVACAGAASAVVPLSSPIPLGPTAHVDIALMSGPAVAASPFGVYTTM